MKSHVIKVACTILTFFALTACATVSSGEKPKWNFKTAKARLEAHPLPSNRWVPRDRAKWVTDREFVEYIRRNTPSGISLRYYYGINMFGKKRIIGVVFK